MCLFFFFFLMIRRPPRSTQSRSSAASDVYKRQINSPLVSVRVGGNNGDNIDNNNNPPDNVDYNEVAADSNNTPAQYESFSNSGELSTPTTCLLYTSPSPRDRTRSRMPSSA
eukprot:TRINITY_DN2899_c0_g1_i1.p1 TRINITY_DN2899_c0_g1~~TRINITY_DN2899_c0_g1_i1.p1  ORF type:complete len:112 (-),score=70.68 TRINITY_DN2899_c0_g1_i1:128-463(-)